MAARKPLVLVSGALQEMPAADSIGIADGGTGGTTAATARTALGLGSAALLTAATGVNDLTAGRVMRIGDGGILGDIPVTVINLDNRALRGWANANATTGSGTYPEGVQFGSVLTFGITGDAVGQLLYSASGVAGITTDVFHRNVYGDNAWGPWQRLNGIVETGSNANGTYTKFSNGQVIANIRKTITTVASAAQYPFTLPTTFITSKPAQCSFACAEGFGYVQYLGDVGTTSCTVGIMHFSGDATIRSITANISVTGWWK